MLNLCGFFTLKNINNVKNHILLGKIYFFIKYQNVSFMLKIVTK